MKSGSDAGMKMLSLSPLLSYWPRRCRLSLFFLLLLLLLQCGCRPSTNIGGGVMAQQAPNASLQIEPFTAVPTSFRQDFCTLSRSANLTNIGSLLQGVALNTNILLGEFIKFDKGDEDNFDNDNAQMLHMILHPNYPGLMARIMDEICLRAGCTWRNSYSIIGAIPENTTWSDLLYWSTDTYDISVEWWMRSTERMRHGAAFIEPWYVYYFSIIHCCALSLSFHFYFPVLFKPFLRHAPRPTHVSLFYPTCTGTTHPSLW
jgi:hypothetical protein